MSSPTKPKKICKKFGNTLIRLDWKKQADKYYFDIMERCQELVFNFNQGKNYSKLIENLKGVRSHKHIIFYRILKNGKIEIERILHEKMDIDKHFNE